MPQTSSSAKLGVNVDHVATLRQARCEGYPSVIDAVKQALLGGADSIVAHLREDRRHIQDKDIFEIRKAAPRFDMEMAATREMLSISRRAKPDMVTLVPEKRAELTTEGGLDVAGNEKYLREYVGKLESSGIRVSLFVDPDERQIRASSRVGASIVEIHTGAYANKPSKTELKKVIECVGLAGDLGLGVNAGHGLNYKNVKPIARIEGISELNIGYSVIARAVFVGIRNAVSEMKKLMAMALLLVIFGSSAFATVEATSDSSPTTHTSTPMLYDVPSDHWAMTSVNELVRLGVTQGYPDGTYRGEANLSRYEMAVFLSKLHHAGEEQRAENEKLFEELKYEVYKLRYELKGYKRETGIESPVSGTLYTRLRLGNVFPGGANPPEPAVPFGPVFDYRLIANYRHDFSDYSFIRVGLDTMDTSYSRGRDLVREMLEAEGQAVSSSGLGVAMTAGPGIVEHREGPSNIFPSEDHMVYLRPNNGIRFFYGPGDAEYGLGYRSTSTESNGIASINDTYAYYNMIFRDTILGRASFRYTVDYFNNSARAGYATSEIYLDMYEIEFSKSRQLKVNISFAALSDFETPHNTFARVSLLSQDLITEGSDILFYVNKTGKEFLAYPVYPGLIGVNLFNKLFVNGTADVGLMVYQAFSKMFAFRLTSDFVTGPSGVYGKDQEDSSFTLEGDLEIGLQENAVLIIGYRSYEQPSLDVNPGSDMLGVGLKCTF